MYILKTTENNQTTLKRTSDYIEAIIELSKAEKAELYEKHDSKPAKQIGYTSKEIE